MIFVCADDFVDIVSLVFSIYGVLLHSLCFTVGRGILFLRYYNSLWFVVYNIAVSILCTTKQSISPVWYGTFSGLMTEQKR